LAAVLYGHFAVSGGLDNSAGCCLCGFIAEADDCDRFDYAWRAVLADFSAGIEVAHSFSGTGAFQLWDIPRRRAFLESLSEVLTGCALVPLGAFVVREHFSQLSSADRAILAAEGIDSPLDLTFYDLTERIILLFNQEPQSATERYRELINKYLSRYLLWPHLMGALAFANARDCSHLQAAKLLAETVLFCERQKCVPERDGTFVPIPPGLQKMTERIQREGVFDAVKVKQLTAKLKALRQRLG
jgi:hypothetical protein